MAVVVYFDPGGGVSEGVGAFFQGGDPGGVVVWGGYVGTDPQDGAGPEFFQHRFAQRLTGRHLRRLGGWELVIPLTVGGNVGIRIQGGWNICHKESEYGRAVYCHATNSGPL